MNRFVTILFVIIWGALLGVVSVALKVMIKLPEDSPWPAVLSGCIVGAGVVGGIVSLNILKKKHTSDDHTSD